LQICNSFQSPELINDGETTAPSKRILKLIPTYKKITDGIIIARKIGLEIMREKCPHFNQWLTQLENLAQLD
jgi:trehalose-6-phosphate synthase